MLKLASRGGGGGAPRSNTLAAGVTGDRKRASGEPKSTGGSPLAPSVHPPEKCIRRMSSLIHCGALSLILMDHLFRSWPQRSSLSPPHLLRRPPFLGRPALGLASYGPHVRSLQRQTRLADRVEHDRVASVLFVCVVY